MVLVSLAQWCSCSEAVDWLEGAKVVAREWEKDEESQREQESAVVMAMHLPMLCQRVYSQVCN